MNMVDVMKVLTKRGANKDVQDQQVCPLSSISQKYICLSKILIIQTVDLLHNP